MQGLYIHIPFCRQACSYCDFHFSTLLKNQDALLADMLTEIRLRHNYLLNKHLDTIYFGGGTPSILSEKQLDSFFNELGRYFSWDKTAEITLEANPEDLTNQKLTHFLKAGVSRISLGIQSLNDEELRWMNRNHTAKMSEEAIQRSQDIGIDNINIDLIYGSRFQTCDTLRETVEKVLKFKLKHISAYNLTIEDRTRLGSDFRKGLEKEVDKNLSADQFQLLEDLLGANGYAHYEISNYALQGFHSKHNTNYWLGGHYLGIGPSAHSFNGHSRQWNISNNAQYQKAIQSGLSYFEIEELSRDNKYNEYVLTRLRTSWGCNAQAIEHEFGKKYLGHFLQGVVRFGPEFIENKQGSYQLTTSGKLIADKIATDFFI